MFESVLCMVVFCVFMLLFMGLTVELSVCKMSHVVEDCGASSDLKCAESDNSARPQFGGRLLPSGALDGTIFQHNAWFV